MASVEKTDSLNLNHWKLCNKVKSCVFTKRTSKLSNTTRMKLSKYKILNSQISSRFSRNLRIRYVNPAIHVESLSRLKSKLHKEVFQKKSHSADLRTKISNIYINTDRSSLFYTCCGSLILSKLFETSSTSKSKSFHTIKRRYKIDDQSLIFIDCSRPEVQRFFVNGNTIIKFSTSLSNYILSQHDSSVFVSKKKAYDEWIKKKRRDILKKKKEDNKLELTKKIEEERLKQEKKMRKKLNHYNFLVWIEKKKKENIHKRITAEKKLKLKRQVKESKIKAIIAKKIHIQQWYLKKKRERRAQKKDRELKLRKLEKERQNKLEESLKAFKNWREKTKNRPKPATQGFLPHQQVKPKYINPIPWIVDEILLEINESQMVNNEATLNPIKSNVKKTVVQK